MSKQFLSNGRIQKSAKVGAILIAGALSLPTSVQARPLPALSRLFDVRSQTTIEGTVTGKGGNGRFDVAVDGAGTYVVQSDRSNSGVRFEVGDRVRVYGEQNGGVFVARTIQMLDDSTDTNTENGQATDFFGTVTDVKSATRFLLRDERGHSYTVDSGTRLPNLRGARRVHVVGVLRRSHIAATSVTVVDGNGGSGMQEGKNVNFVATVVERLSDRRLRVQANNRYPTEIQTAFDVGNINVNDRVQIRGRMIGQIITAVEVTRIGSISPNRPPVREPKPTVRPKPIGRIGITATILSTDDAERTMVVRDAKGTVYTVEYEATRNFVKGNRITLSGTLYPGHIIVANSILLQK